MNFRLKLHPFEDNQTFSPQPSSGFYLRRETLEIFGPNYSDIIYSLHAGHLSSSIQCHNDTVSGRIGTEVLA